MAENKARSFILQAAKRAQKNPSQAKQAQAETRAFAREMIRARKQSARLHTSRATLESVKLQVNEAFAMRKIQAGLKTSAEIMHEVNLLIKLPELTTTMRELSQELVKAGIIEEMVDDMVPTGEEFEGEEEEAEAEVDKILGEILKDKTAAPQLPSEPLGPVEAQPEEEDMDSEEMLKQMRGRLEALKS